MVVWLPLLAVIRLFDRDPAHYTTGLWFRRLGNAMTRVNPMWDIEVTDTELVTNPRNPYVVVCNHQSIADIPIVSRVPWEMKWMGKAEMLKIPLVSWMLRLAGDIMVDRSNPRSGAAAIIKAKEYLQKKCSVFIFPEGTRSPDGKLHEFNDGAFVLALKSRTPVLVLALDGTSNALPKNSWKFTNPGKIRVKVLGVIDVADYGRRDTGAVRDRARSMIATQLAEWRGTEVTDVVAQLPEKATA